MKKLIIAFATVFVVLGGLAINAAVKGSAETLPAWQAEPDNSFVFNFRSPVLWLNVGDSIPHDFLVTTNKDVELTYNVYGDAVDPFELLALRTGEARIELKANEVTKTFIVIVS